MTEQLTNLIKQDKPFIFVKFGDGEYNAMIGLSGTNCDSDLYTAQKQNGLIEAIKYYSLLDDFYCGYWPNEVISNYYSSIVSKPINWIDYHACIMCLDTCFETNAKLELFKSIKNSKRKKVLVGNELLVKAKYLLNTEHVIVPYQNWLETELQIIINRITSYFNNDPNPMILTCAGMGSKILIMELHKQFPNGIYIDIGSGLDYLCTKKCSRGWKHSYDKLEAYFQEILPPNWNDSEFNIIYDKSKAYYGAYVP